MKLSAISIWAAVLCLMAGSPDAHAADIVEAASEAGQFTMLLQAVKQAGLEGKMKTPGPFTVFAPTDAAFSALPPEVSQRLMDPDNKAELAGVLSYHLLAGRLLSADVAGKNAEVKALTGQGLVVNGEGENLTVNGAKVSTRDMIVDNGVVHVIDEVLLPPTPVQPRM